MSKIQNIIAREILDSRGNPTVEVDLHLKNGMRARSSCPSGASIGSKEALELRDKNPKRFSGKGVLKAIENIHTIIKPNLIGKDCKDQKGIDALLIELDGTPNKSKLGSNAIITVSSAVLKAAAAFHNLELSQYINPAAVTLPVPLMNILNGGIHADNKLDIQEFMIVPVGATNIKDAVRMGTEIFYELKLLLKRLNLDTAVGDEGGFAPHIEHATKAIELIFKAVELSGYKIGSDILLALDVAASELYRDHRYYFKGENKSFSSDELIRYYEQLVHDYPIHSIEDGMSEEDYTGWENFTSALGQKIQLVGDDLFVTNPQILAAGINQGLANAILIKPNQVGSISETFNAINLAHANDYNCIMSHRSGGN